MPNTKGQMAAIKIGPRKSANGKLMSIAQYQQIWEANAHAYLLQCPPLTTLLKPLFEIYRALEYQLCAAATG